MSERRKESPIPLNTSLYSMLIRLRNFTLQFVHRPWFPILIALCAGLDLIIFVVPIDLLLIAAVLAQPRRWIFISLVIAFGSALGCVLLGLFISIDKEFILHHFPSIFHSYGWRYAEQMLDKHGALSMFLGALGPFPLHAFVFVGALRLPIISLGLGIFLGRAVKFLFFSWCAHYAPHLLEKIPIVNKSARHLKTNFVVSPSKKADSKKD